MRRRRAITYNRKKTKLSPLTICFIWLRDWTLMGAGLLDSLALSGLTAKVLLFEDPNELVWAFWTLNVRCGKFIPIFRQRSRDHALEEYIWYLRVVHALQTDPHPILPFELIQVLAEVVHRFLSGGGEPEVPRERDDRAWVALPLVRVFQLLPCFVGVGTADDVDHLRVRDVIHDEAPSEGIIGVPVVRAGGVVGSIGTFDASIDVSLEAVHLQHRHHPLAPDDPVFAVQGVVYVEGTRNLVGTDSRDAWLFEATKRFPEVTWISLDTGALLDVFCISSVFLTGRRTNRGRASTSIVGIHCVVG
jgi:hypothetical protein